MPSLEDPVKMPLEVVIVGAGFCGLAAAIECRQRGMMVTVVETYPTSRTQGDVIDFFGNGGQIIASWDDGNMAKTLLDVCINQNDSFHFYNAKGEYLTAEPWHLHPHHAGRQFAGHRGEMHDIISRYAERIGVKFEFGETVVDYLDDKNSQNNNANNDSDTNNDIKHRHAPNKRPSGGDTTASSKVGVLCKSGRTFEGDVVLACDGPKSLARQKILGLEDNKVNSGYAIYRAFYTLTPEMRRNLYMSRFTEKDDDFTGIWVGKDAHGVIYSWNKGRDIAWALTHKDSHDIGESWSFPGSKADVMSCLDEAGFCEPWRELVRLTPEDQLVDYKLVWRAPLQTWIGSSPSPRMIVLGDAAHCHLPSSGQGASQSVEDGAAIAVCLDRAGGDVALALRVFERIRFNRQNLIHLTSIQNRDDYHNVEWTPEFVKDHPEALSLYRQDWVLEHDARANAEMHFDELAARVQAGEEGEGKELCNLALPAGGEAHQYIHVPSS